MGAPDNQIRLMEPRQRKFTYYSVNINFISTTKILQSYLMPDK